MEIEKTESWGGVLIELSSVNKDTSDWGIMGVAYNKIVDVGMIGILWFYIDAGDFTLITSRAAAISQK